MRLFAPMPAVTRRILCAISAATTLAPPLHAQRVAPEHPTSVCARAPAPAPHAPSPALYCIDLVPAPDFPNAAGAVELRRVPSPFGAAVTADGRHSWDLRLTLAGLPDPRSLGVSTYVAWATT